MYFGVQITWIIILLFLKCVNGAFSDQMKPDTTSKKQIRTVRSGTTREVTQTKICSTPLTECNSSPKTVPRI